MKKIISVFITGVLAFSSCTNFLTVQPKTADTANKLFQTDEGIIEGITGTYILLADKVYRPDGYIGMGFTDKMADLYFFHTSPPSPEASLPKHEWEVVLDLDIYEDFFETLFKVVSNLNPLIEESEKNKDKLTEEIYNIVRGEAHAMRACVLMEAMRLWGPSPAVPEQYESGSGYLPYPKTNSPKKYTYLSFKDFMQEVINDLQLAEDFLYLSDPIRLESNEVLNEKLDGIMTMRQKRFNYYGVLALRARAEHWRKNYPEAINYAKKVITATDPDGSRKFRLATSADLATDGLFFPEHISGISINGFFNYNTSEWPRPNALCKEEKQGYTSVLANIYENNTSDVRYNQFVSHVSPTGGAKAQQDGKFNRLVPGGSSAMSYPVIRLSELYLIIMDGTDDVDEINTYYERLCEARSATFTALTDKMDEEKFCREFCKEFHGEGLVFQAFKYKARNKMIYQQSWSTDGWEPEDYILPLPKAEYKQNEE